MSDAPLITLKSALSYFEQGTMTVSTLRLERDRGRLQTYRVGAREFTTIEDVRRMVDQCRVDRGGRISTGEKPARSEGAEATGKSKTAIRLSPRDTALARMTARDESLRRTSSNTRQPRASNVVPMK